MVRLGFKLISENASEPRSFKIIPLDDLQVTGGKVWEVKIKGIGFIFENGTPRLKIVALFF